MRAKTALRHMRRWTSRGCLFMAVLALLIVKVSLPGTTEASSHGFIQVAPNSRYFQFQDGTPFVPVGVHNYAIIERTASHRDSGDNYAPNRAEYEAFFRLLKASGMNVIRILLDGPGYWLEEQLAGCGIHPGCNLDCPVEYNVPIRETIDYLFSLAEKYDVYLQIDILQPGSVWLEMGLRALGGVRMDDDPPLLGRSGRLHSEHESKQHGQQGEHR